MAERGTGSSGKSGISPCPSLSQFPPLKSFVLLILFESFSPINPSVSSCWAGATHDYMKSRVSAEWKGQGPPVL